MTRTDYTGAHSMSAKQMALDALKRLVATDDAHATINAPDGDDVARMIEYAEAFDHARETIAALEADIAQAVEPVAYCVSIDGKKPYSNFGEDLDYVSVARNTIGGTAVVMNLYTTPPEPAVNAELLEALEGGTV